MDHHSYDKLDMIMALGAAKYAEKLTSQFLNSNPDFEISEQTDRKILRMIRKENHRTSRQQAWKIARFVMVACLIAATIAFTACMAIPRIRQAIWKAVLDWKDDYVVVDFVPADKDNNKPALTSAADPATTSSVDTPDKPTPEVPVTVEEINLPSYMPLGYSTQSSHEPGMFVLEYYNSDGDIAFAYRQTIIDTNDIANATGADAADITINGFNAVLFTYPNSPGDYILFWQDNQYRYSLTGTFESYDELIRIASSVEVK